MSRHTVTRRHFAQAAAGAALGLPLLTGQAIGKDGGAPIGKTGKGMAMAVSQNNVMSGQSLMADVETYVGFGLHHTGLAGDLATSAWQENWLDQHGYDVTTSNVPVRQYISLRADAQLDSGKMVDLWYQWPQPVADFSLEAPLIDRITNPAATIPKGAIVLVRIKGNSIDLPDNLAQIMPALDAGAAAIIAVCSHESGRYQIGNVKETLPAFAAPVVLAGSNDLVDLRAAHAVKISLNGHYQQAIGKSVTGKIDRGKKWLVVSTPQSGWTTCGGERGPGIALFRAFAALLAKNPEGPSLCFTSNSGHEFHNLGARIIHDRDDVPGPKDTAMWLHLGAGVASRDWSVDQNGTITHLDHHKGTLLMVTPDLEDVPATVSAPDHIKTLSYSTDRFNVGEMLDVTANGYEPAIGVVGEQSHHHVFGDLAQTTSPEILEGVAQYLMAVTHKVLEG